MLIIARILVAVVFGTLISQGAQAQQPRAGSENEMAAPARKGANQSPKERINAWTVGLAGGQLEGAPLRLASEIARVVDDGDNAHVLPIVTRGPTENVNSLLYLRGVDMAIINTDVLDEYKAQVPNIQQQITYVLNLFPSELHIFVRPEIQSLDDLRGKKVNFNTLGTAAAYSGPLIFARLGLDVEKTFIPHPVALEQMKSGAISAVMFITSKPVDAFLKGSGSRVSNFCRSNTAASSRIIIFHRNWSRRTIPALFRRAATSRPLPFQPSLPPITGPGIRTGTGAWPALSTICSAGWKPFRAPGSIRSGRTSTLPPKCPAWNAIVRHRSGWINPLGQRKWFAKRKQLGKTAEDIEDFDEIYNFAGDFVSFSREPIRTCAAYRRPSGENPGLDNQRDQVAGRLQSSDQCDDLFSLVSG